jgi:hypothetical protein
MIKKNKFRRKGKFLKMLFTIIIKSKSVMNVMVPYVK